MSLRIFIMLILWLLLHIYAFWRLFRWRGVKSVWLPVAAGFGVCGLSFVIKMLYGFKVIDPAGALNRLADMWSGYLLLLVSTLWCLEVVGFIFRKRPASRPILFYVAVVTSIALTVISFFLARTVRVRHITLPADIDCRIVQFSDLHLGYMSEGQLIKVIGLVSSLDADFAILAGDLIDRHNSETDSKLDMLEDINIPVYMTIGNHEIYAGFRKTIDQMEKSSIELLVESWAEPVDGVRVFGAVDSQQDWQVRRTLSEEQNIASDDSYDIFVNHSPVGASIAAEKKFELMLSGHTHGGQILPFGLFVRMRYDYLYGLYDVGQMKLSVSSGAGFWGPPMRFPGTGEIVCIDLKSGSAAADNNKSATPQ